MNTVRLEKIRPHVTLVTLDRPERLNAMSFGLMTDLYEAFRQVPGIDEMALSRVGMVAMTHFSQVVPVMRDLPQPIIAAINGAAYGGGLCLSLGADLRFCSESAVFNATGIVNGLTSTELGASFLLPRLIGASRSNDLLLTGRKLDAREAERIGLVSRVLPDGEVVNHAIETAEAMCELSAFGLQMTKKVCWSNLETNSLAAAIELEDRNQLLLGNTENLLECIAARREKRKPVYTDRPRTDLRRD
jgi:enoyl-CoA hydratase